MLARLSAGGGGGASGGDGRSGGGGRGGSSRIIAATRWIHGSSSLDAGRSHGLGPGVFLRCQIHCPHFRIQRQHGSATAGDATSGSHIEI
jgi:hypothetical protein